MKKVVGVTSCPAGIAHTYMAAEAVERFCKKLGYQVKMETQGAGGVENRLSEDDIREADFVVIAADTTVDMSRFEGKRIIETSVGKAIRQADTVLAELKEG